VSGWPRRLGALLQGLTLGGLLLWALVNLMTVEMGARIFRYQGF
jgi:hypothetical protein